MRLAIGFAALLVLASPAAAQVQAPTQTTPGRGMLGNLLGGALPNVGGVGLGNAAGLLGYCLQNNLLGGAAGRPATTVPAGQQRAAGAQSVLDRLLGRQGVANSPSYQAGQQGQVQAPNGRAVALGGLDTRLRTQMCNVVLDRARSFL